jgi:DNA polymerase I-like protein with 3'-5' exonuclease and polymerase domains
MITCDLETYYDKDYSLTKLTTEEYIRDARFEVIGLSVKCDDAPAEWFSGDHAAIKNWLQKFDWAGDAVCAHNSPFDLSILAWIFDITPGFMLDTLSMARAVNGVEVGGSLAKLVKQYELGEKGNEVIQAIGKHRRDFNPIELANYGNYCKNDTELTYKLFHKLSQGFPQAELELIHLTLLMYTRPILLLDQPLLEARLTTVQEEKKALLYGLMSHLKCTDEEQVRKKLCSNPQFASLLADLNVPLPMKVSPTTEKETYAFAKTDLGFIALEEHPNPLVQQLCSVRLGTKSTLEESRLERFVGISLRNAGTLPVPLKYMATPTARWGGSDAVNLQNLPTRDKTKNTLKKAIIAPKGHVILNADSSQIEARWLVYLSGQENIVEAFKQNRDVYCEDASEIYGRTITKKDITERHVGKTTRLQLGYGTGALKLQHTLQVSNPSIKLSLPECKRIVGIYRQTNSQVTELWKQGDLLLKQLLSWPEDGGSFYFGKNNIVMLTPFGIRMPNELYIRYPNLRVVKEQMIYDSRKGPVNVWGGVVTANVISYLARCTIAEQMLKVAEKYSITLVVHDSMVLAIKESEVDTATTFIREVMTTPPTWAPGLPINCEIKTGASYGDC